MPTMNPFPHSSASKPRSARGTRPKSISPGFSDSARITTCQPAQGPRPRAQAVRRTELVPSTVPRMVCGRKNFQKAPSSDADGAGC